MNAEKVLLWAIINHTGVDFSVNDETFQISNLGKGFWKRHFHADSHPTRENVSSAEIQKALDSAIEFSVYEEQKTKKVSRQEFEQMVTSVLNS